MSVENKYVAVDLDGCIAEYDGWKGEEHIGDPKEGVIEALETIHKNYKIIIHTCRANRKIIKEYLEKHDIPYDYINENPEQPETAGEDKIFAHHYIDDRAIEFDDNWEQIKMWFDFDEFEERKPDFCPYCGKILGQVSDDIVGVISYSEVTDEIMCSSCAERMDERYEVEWEEDPERYLEIHGSPPRYVMREAERDE